MLDSLLGQVLGGGPIFALIVGALVFATLRGLKGVFLFVDNLPPWGKQLAAVALAFVFMALTRLVPGFHAPAACAADALGQACRDAISDKTFLTPILGAVVSMLLHAGQKAGEKR